MKQHSIQKVLIIRFSSIGDIVLTSPVIRCLKTQSPETEIHYLTKKQNYPLLKANPSVSRIWQFDDNFSELVPLLRSEEFDFIIDLHRNFRSRYVIYKLSAPSATFPKLNFRKWLRVQVKINILPEIHIVDRYFKALTRMKIHNDGQGLDYFIPPDEEVDISGWIPDTQQDYIAFSIGGKHNTKILPEELITALCKEIELPVFLLGGLKIKKGVKESREIQVPM